MNYFRHFFASRVSKGSIVKCKLLLPPRLLPSDLLGVTPAPQKPNKKKQIRAYNIFTRDKHVITGIYTPVYSSVPTHTPTQHKPPKNQQNTNRGNERKKRTPKTHTRICVANHKRRHPQPCVCVRCRPQPLFPPIDTSTPSTPSVPT